MEPSTKNTSKENAAVFSESGTLALVVVSLLTLIAAFLISNSDLSFQLRTLVFAAVVIIYILFCGRFFLLKKGAINSPAADSENSDSDEEFSPEVREKLLFLEEANSFFGHSLKSADMFRLVSNRINEMISCSTCVLYLVDESGFKLKAAQSAGENAAEFLKVESGFEKGLAGKTFQDQKARLDEKLTLDKEIFSPELINNVKNAAAVPLWKKDEVFGVLALYGGRENNFDKKSVLLLEEIGLRVSQLFLNSLTFERNLENSLIDALTKLPNERAFYLILENQIAESRRVGEAQRPLTVLSMDIQKFDEINRNYGFATGDRILTLAAKIIKGQLRQMDFLARSKSDEFIAILPTANEEITRVIIERIEKALNMNPFEIEKDNEIRFKLNFGGATFSKTDETAQQLLKRAELKKQNSKSPVKSSVLLFPGELVS